MVSRSPRLVPVLLLAPILGVLATLLVVGVAHPGVARGATATPPACEDLQLGTVDTAALPQVAVTATVPARLGTASLPASAFTVRQGGDELPLISASRLPESGLEVVVVVDNAAATGAGSLAAAQGAAVELIVGLPDQALTGVVTAGGEPRVLARVPSAKAAASQALASATPAGPRRTVDALALALEQFPAATGGRRHIVVFSAGSDAGSTADPQAVALALQASDVTLHRVDFGSEPADAAALPGTGCPGRVEPAQLVSAVDAVLGRLRGQYQLQFQADPDAGDVTVEVGLQGLRGTAVLPLSAPPGAAPAAPPGGSGSDDSGGAGASAAGDSGDTALRVGLIAAAVLLVGGVGALLLLRRPGSEPQAAAGTAGGVPPRPAAAPPAPVAAASSTPRRPLSAPVSGSPLLKVSGPASVSTPVSPPLTAGRPVSGGAPTAAGRGSVVIATEPPRTRPPARDEPVRPAPLPFTPPTGEPTPAPVPSYQADPVLLALAEAGASPDRLTALAASHPRRAGRAAWTVVAERVRSGAPLARAVEQSQSGDPTLAAAGQALRVAAETGADPAPLLRTAALVCGAQSAVAASRWTAHRPVLLGAAALTALPVLAVTLRLVTGSSDGARGALGWLAGAAGLAFIALGALRLRAAADPALARSDARAGAPRRTLEHAEARAAAVAERAALYAAAGGELEVALARGEASYLVRPDGLPARPDRNGTWGRTLEGEELGTADRAAAEDLRRLAGLQRSGGALPPEALVAAAAAVRARSAQRVRNRRLALLPLLTPALLLLAGTALLALAI